MPAPTLTASGPAIPGQDLVATLTTTEPLQDVAVALVRTEHYRRKGEKELPDSDNTSSTEDAVDLLLYATSSPSTDETEVEIVETVELGGVEGTREFRLQIPADAEPSAPDLIEWVVRVFRDAEAEAPLEVTTTPVHADAAKYDGTGDGATWISARVPGGVLAVARGQRLSGAVVLKPPSGGSLSEVRIAVIRMHGDDVGAREQSRVAAAQVSGPLDLEAGVRQELAFALEIPADTPPTCITSHNARHYWLQITAARRMRKDFKNDLRLYVAAAA
jgi:hypothetical protein